MKRALFASALIFSSLTASENDITSRMHNFYQMIIGKTIEVETIKKDSEYILKFSEKNGNYRIFDENATIKIDVDEGPIVTNPEFTIAKLGLVSRFDLIKIFNKEIREDIKRSLKKKVYFSYKGIIDYSNKLKESVQVDPFYFEKDGVSLKTSTISYKSDINLDTYTGTIDIAMDTLEFNDTKSAGNFALKGVKSKYLIPEPPVDGIILFAQNNFSIDKLYFEDPKVAKIQFGANFDSSIKKVDNKNLDVMFDIRLATEDLDTIVITRGIKKSNIKFAVKKLDIKGTVDLMKLSYEFEQIEKRGTTALIDKKPEVTAQYLAQLDEISQKIVPIFNKMVKKGETEFLVDISLLSRKESFIKLDLVYNAEPLSGDINSALISLAAKGLSIVNGKFDIQLEESLVTNINFMAKIVMDMLTSKGLAKSDKGIFTLKGELKDGKVIINGKSYTLKELSRVLF